MTKSQIKAELRRSALEDVDPYYGVSWEAHVKVIEFRADNESLSFSGRDTVAIFFLLIAEAL